MSVVRKITLSLLLVCVTVCGQNSPADSLLERFNTAGHDTMRCHLLNALIDVSPDGVWEDYNAQLKSISEKGVAAGGSLKLFYLDYLLTAINNEGFIYYNKGNVPKALEAFSKCLKLREETGDKEGISLSLNNIGNIYLDQGEDNIALDYFTRSLKIAEETGNKIRIASGLASLGFLYEGKGELRKALSYLEKGMKYDEASGNKDGIGNSLHNIGMIYFDLGETDKALEYLAKSRRIREEIGNKGGAAYSLLQIGCAYLKKGNRNEARSCGEKSLREAKEIGFPENIRDASKLLAHIYRLDGKYALSLQHLEMYIEMRDSLNNQENKKASIKNQLRYEYEKKAAADSVKTAEERKVTQALLNQERTVRYALYGGLSLTAVFSLVMVNRFRITRKQKRFIEIQKKKVESQKHLVEEKQKEILDSIHYAQRIQKALITSDRYIHKALVRLHRH